MKGKCYGLQNFNKEWIKMNKNLTQGGRPILNANNLHAYQHRAVDFILESPEVALFLDMGL